MEVKIRNMKVRNVVDARLSLATKTDRDKPDKKPKSARCRVSNAIYRLYN